MKKILIPLLTIFTVLTSLSSTLAADFPDAPADAWFTPYIQEAVEEGLMQGNPDGTFGSWEPMNRAEFAKVIVEFNKKFQEPWWEEHLFEIVLVLITLAGWITVAAFMYKVSERPIILQEKKTPPAPPTLPKNSRLIAETPAPESSNKLEKDFVGEEQEKKKKTNWWL